MELIDTHCHLQFDAYHGREDDVIAAATHAGVKKFICVGTSLKDSKAAASIAQDKKNVWATAGVHPHDASQFLTDPNGAKKLNKIIDLPKVVAVGEVGLDHYKMYSPKDVQEQVLKAQLEVGLKQGLPFIFHIRDAWDSFWPIFDSYKAVRGVIHSFSTDQRQLDKILSRGLYIGLNGIMTFTEDKAQLAAARAVPDEYLVLETDAPFLTPVPFRNELCEPKHIVSTAEFLAELRGQKLEELAKISTVNAIELFGLDS